MKSLARWKKVEDLREKLNGRAKAEGGYRFYSLHDKIYRKDFLEAAYAQCLANDGAPGVDGKTFKDIEAHGVERYLRELAEELKELRYLPQPVRRVMIPKENQPGKYRPLGIPTIRDRIVQQAVKLLLEPIFEADFTDNAYGYRPGKSAQDALTEVSTCLRSGHTEVVDADLSKYFDTIPHQELMKSVERRIADHKVLWMIRKWLKTPVHESNAKGKTVMSGGKKTKVGTPQGGVISPLLANIYFRRFLVAWKQLGFEEKYKSKIVNYADDFVILTQGHAQEALRTAHVLLTKIGLTLNETKTRTVNAWSESFTFLGHTFGKLHGKGGRPYLGNTPSDKSVQKHREKVRQLTSADQTTKSLEDVTTALNRLTQGFWNYFKIGTVKKIARDLDQNLWEHMTGWAKRKYKRPHRRKQAGKSGQATRRARIQAALDKLIWGQELCRRRNGGPLFAAAASYAQ